MNKEKRKNWIKFLVILVAYILFLVWIRSWFGLIFIPFIFDYFISKKINWGFWKNIENPLLRNVMSWLDAIVFGLIAVSLVNIYFIQMYQIPTSSLEKSLLVGDHLLVSKINYGARRPNTPLSFPLTQHTLPILNTKSYIENPQWEYKRAKGFQDIKLNDIVVFNFPAGDTVAENFQSVDFYRLAFAEGVKVVRMDDEHLNVAERIKRKRMIIKAGTEIIKSNKDIFGEIISRPVDRRDSYVKRCVGLPGNEFSIIDGQIHINGKAIENPKDMQHNYYVQTNGMLIPEEIFEDLGISIDDINIVTEESETLLDRYITKLDKEVNGRLCPVYYLPLTQEMYNKLNNNKKLIHKIVREVNFEDPTIYPIGIMSSWSADNYGPIYIPKRGDKIELTPNNIALYERCIVAYEKNKLDIKEDGIYINGEKQTHYTFKMDYYWMMGDNRGNSADSRYWGFVPEDHIVGKPIFVWLSLNKDKGWLNGRIRWNRFFKFVH